jgi:DNA-binding NarL/FixJ family response regulator
VSSICQEEPSASGVLADVPDPGLTLVVGGNQRISVILEEQGFEFTPLDTAEELFDSDAAPSLVILWVEGVLSQTVARELEQLRREVGEARVVLVCADIRPGELRAALVAGAAGVVIEAQLASALGPCLAAVRAEQVCVPMQHSRQIEPAALSAREKQILGLVVMGYMNSQIAEQLFVAESTVKSHLSSAFGKLGVRSRNEAVDLILDPERGLGMGILSLGGEPVEAATVTGT